MYCHVATRNAFCVILVVVAVERSPIKGKKAATGADDDPFVIQPSPAKRLKKGACMHILVL